MMKLAVSNIAWDIHDDINIIEMLIKHGVTGIEAAPTKIWPKWKGATYESAVSYKKRMADIGLEIPALQAILFGRTDLAFFDGKSHNDFVKHIDTVAKIASGLGAKVLVLGAPKNRKRGQLSSSSAVEMASGLLRKLGKICYEHNCVIGLEHNPVEYGCDFITNVADAREMVDMVAHPGVQLHIDSAGVHMCGADIGDIIENAGDFAHYHISEPMLEPISQGVVDHKRAFSTLAKLSYPNWISLEMKMPKSNELLESSLLKLQKMLTSILL